ncbi:hypothetical protein ACPOL_4047 [Acidisarcina polymorpha]|uniref:Uncharacterized protein n=1 Tax=Acidisarcina polymorpha TaxID=2211140 RepID=A0A2Z5G486_9BACT|nr:hypothetical protein ACPOL_4047 [Acidisarcina polymorpha]
MRFKQSFDSLSFATLVLLDAVTIMSSLGDVYVGQRRPV